MSEIHHEPLPDLGSADPTIRRITERSRASRRTTRRIVVALAGLLGLGISWCIYLGATGRYTTHRNVLFAVLAILGLGLQGYAYARRLEDEGELQ